MISLQKKVYFIFAIVIMVPMIFVTFVFHHMMEERLVGQIREADLKTIHTIEHSIKSTMNYVESYGELIANDENVKNFLINTLSQAKTDKSYYLKADSSTVFHRYLESDSISYISLLSADGYLIGEQTLNAERLNYVFNQHFFRKLDATKNTWEKMYTIEVKDTGETYKVFPCLIPINDQANHQNLGYIALFLNERSLYNTYSHYGDRIYILNDEQCILSYEDPSYLQKDLYAATKIGYSQVLKNESSVIDSEVVLTTKEVDWLGWQVVILSPFSIFTPVGNFSTTYIWVMIASLLMFATIMGIIIAKNITRPIVSLTQTMHMINEGDLSQRFDHTSNDEIGLLSRSFNSMLDTIQSLMTKVLEEERLKQHYKLQLIQSQVNPHFLYNAIEMINSLVRLDLKEEVLTTTSSLSDFYRLSLSDGASIISIEEEVSLVKNFLTIQQLRYIEFLEYTIDIDPMIMEYTIPKLTLQPVIENSIYHGLKEQGYKGYLSITGKLIGDNIQFIIEDNGKGMSVEKLEAVNNPTNKSIYFGINCIKDRLHLYYEDETDFMLESELGNYTRTTITIPCKR